MSDEADMLTTMGRDAGDGIDHRRRMTAADERSEADKETKCHRIRFDARRIATTVLAVCLLSVGLAAGAAPAAQAATSISFCFRWSTGAPYAKQPVYMRSTSSSTILATGKTAANGCATWATPSYAGVYVQAYVYLQDGPGYQIWNGYTQYYTPAGAGQSSLGTGIVSLYGQG